MSFLNFKNVNLSLNGKTQFLQNLSLSQEADISQPYKEGENTSTKNISIGPTKTQLNIQYYLTGKCPLKEYLFANYKYPLSGRINEDLLFNLGFLQSYNLNAQPNSPISVSATILIAEPISGSMSRFLRNRPEIPQNTIWNFNDSIFSGANSDLNIINYQWTFENEIKPIYYQKDSDLFDISPDRIYFGPKRISVSLTSDSNDLLLPHTGQPIQLNLVCRNPNQNIIEEYPISGQLNRKNFDVSTEDFSKTSYSISQAHVNEQPKISFVNTGSYPASGNFIYIHSLNTNENGFLSNINNINFIERVIIGDDGINFNVFRENDYDIISGIIDEQTINGTLQLQTTKGIITHSPDLILNFPQIGISGFNKISGNFGDLITISGSNFYRIDNVLFDGLSSNFNVSINNTGSIHTLQAVVPQNATVGPITVQSTLRNRSGISNLIFYPQSVIDSFNPVTGVWGGTVTVSGLNFSGVEGLFFNGIPSPSFKVLSNYQITGQIPLTGAGYTKGYVSVSGINGISRSLSFYKPQFPITGLSAISGTSSEDMAIYCLNMDTGFLKESLPQYIGENLMAYYRFNNNANDSFNSNHGTATNILYSGGIVDNAACFNGNYYSNISNINIPQSNIFNTKNVTISAWIYPSPTFDNTNTQVPFTFHGTVLSWTNGSYRLGFWNGNLQFLNNINGSIDNLEVWAGNYLQTGKWHHIAATYDGSTKKIYISGKQIVQKNYFENMALGDSQLNIGSNGGSFSYKGKIDEVGLWNKALNPTEILNIYQNSGYDYVKRPEISYKIAFGDVNTAFSRSGTSNVLTGFIPEGYFDGKRIFLYEPDGVTRYLPYSGAIRQVGPAPKVDNIIGASVATYNSNDILTSPTPILTKYESDYFTLNGKNLKDFFGLPWYVMLSGTVGTTNVMYPEIIRTNNTNYDKLLVTGILTGSTGYYNMTIRNFVGSQTLTGIKLENSSNLASTHATVINTSSGPLSTLTVLAPYEVSAGNAIDDNLDSYSATRGWNYYPVDREMFWLSSFKSNIDIYEMRIKIKSTPDRRDVAGTIYYKVYNCYIEPLLQGVTFSQTKGSPLTYNSSYCPYNYNTGHNFSNDNDYIVTFKNPLTGINKLLIINSGAPGYPGNLMINDVKVYGRIRP